MSSDVTGQVPARAHSLASGARVPPHREMTRQGPVVLSLWDPGEGGVKSVQSATVHRARGADRLG